MVVSAHKPPPETALLAETAWLRRLARHMVGEEDADDVVQDACVAALERPPRDPSRLRGWLAKVVRNAARGRLRDRLRRLRREALAARSERGPLGDDVVVRAETQQRVVDAVLALDEPYRTTVLLRFFDDLPPRKVAERMGVPVATVHTRLRRGLDLLRRRLGDRGRSWALVLFPLLTREGRLGALFTAGGAVMSKKAALIGTVALLALAVGGLLRVSRGGTEAARRDLARSTPAVEEREAPEPEAAPVAAEGRVRLRGRVVDEDGVAIPDARVDLVPGSETPYYDCLRPADAVRREQERMRSPPRATARCDGEGRFDLSADPEPHDSLLVRAPGFATANETALSLLRSATGIEIRLKKQAACRVRVVDEMGAPVAGAHVSLLAAAVLARATTDAEGRADFSAEPRGWSVLVEHAGHADGWGFLRDGKQEEITVRLRAPRVIEGVVLRASDRAPVAGAEVHVAVAVPCFATTDAQGRFRLECGDLAWHPWPAVVADAGPAGCAAVPVADLPPGPLEILLRPPAALEGKLVGPMPLEGLRVFALQPGLPWREATADSSGAFRIEGAAADAPVEVVFDPWNPLYEEKGDLVCDAAYEPWAGFAEIELALKAAVEGRVVDERGEPVAGARVGFGTSDIRGRSVEGLGLLGYCAGDVHADEQGRFRLDGVTARQPRSRRPGISFMPMRPRVSAPGFVWRDEGPFAFEPGEVRTGLLLRLDRGLSITGRVVTEDGSLVPRVKVRAYEQDVAVQQDAHSGSAHVDAEGRYRIDALSAGRYGISVFDEEHQPAWHRDVPAGGEAPPLVLRRGATIEGIVVDEAGNPLPDVDVTALRPGASRSSRDRSGADGRFRIRQLEPGTYDVQAAQHGYLWERKAGVAAPSSDLRFELCRGLSIKGRIVRADGTPIRHVTVRAVRVRGVGAPGSGGQATSDEEGRFDMMGLSDGEFRLSFEGRMQDASLLPPLPGVAAGADILVRAEVGRFIEGRVVDREGRPVQAWIVPVPLDADGYAADGAQSGEDGRYRAGPLKATRYALIAGFGSTYGFATDVEAGATDKDIVMGQGEVVAGKVVDGDGSPRAASVWLTHEKIPHTWQLAAADGRFRIEGLPPGAYFVRALPESVILTGPVRGGTRIEAGTLGAVLTAR